MAIEKSPQNKAIERQSPLTEADKKTDRIKICDASGHQFSEPLQKLIRAKEYQSLPDRAVCIRCGATLVLKTLLGL